MEKTKKKIKGFFAEFKEFAIRGKAIDLAIGVVIGTAFTNIVNTVVSSFIMPLLSLFVLRDEFSSLSIGFFGATFTVGVLLQAILNFVIIAFIVFIIVKILNKIKPTEEESKTADESIALNKEILEELKKINKNLEKK